MSDASREADGYEVERSSADQHTAGEQERFADALHKAVWGLNCPPNMVVPGGVHRHTTDAAEHEAQAEFMRRAVQYAETITGLTPLPATPDAGDASEGLSEAECLSVLRAVDEFSAGRSNYGEVYAAVEKIRSAAATKARAEERERIAQAIDEMKTFAHGNNPQSQAHVLGFGTARRLAARIARLAPDTAGGDR